MASLSMNHYTAQLVDISRWNGDSPILSNIEKVPSLWLAKGIAVQHAAICSAGENDIFSQITSWLWETRVLHHSRYFSDSSGAMRVDLADGL